MFPTEIRKTRISYSPNFIISTVVIDQRSETHVVSAIFLISRIRRLFFSVSR